VANLLEEQTDLFFQECRLLDLNVVAAVRGDHPSAVGGEHAETLLALIPVVVSRFPREDEDR
jgi:hypothetical protein